MYLFVQKKREEIKKFKRGEKKRERGFETAIFSIILSNLDWKVISVDFIEQYSNKLTPVDKRELVKIFD